MSEDQTQDDGDDETSQCVSRVKARPGDTGSMIWMVIAVIAIAAIGGGSTWLRFAHFEAAQVESAAAASDNPFGSAKAALDGPAAAPAEAVPVAASANGAEASEAKAAFIMLGFIFVVTQLVGIGAGYRYSFAGRQSDKAHRDTQGHANYDGYWVRFQRRIDLAQARLQQLQQEMESRSDHDMDFTRNFRDFVRHERSARTIDAFAGSSVPGAGSASSPEAIARAVERLKNTRLESEKVAILAALSDADRNAVKSILRGQKGGGERSIADEFSGLL